MTAAAAPLVPHVLRLVDAGAREGDPAFRPGASLRRAAMGWGPAGADEQTFVFPSFTMAHRVAVALLATDCSVWMPVAVPGSQASVSGDRTCRDCGCTQEFACPSRCSWAESDLCSECARGDEPLVMWTVYSYPVDYPTNVVARKSLSGIPTAELMVENTLQALRARRPAGTTALPRAGTDSGNIVEVWV